jgi:hypothetical protein
MRSESRRGREAEIVRDSERCSKIIVTISSEQILPIQIAQNNSAPTVGINTTATPTQFSISINRIAELSEKMEIRSIFISSITFTKLPDITSGKNTISTYNALLANGANVSVIVSEYTLPCHSPTLSLFIILLV